jgi:hypothetical protein
MFAKVASINLRMTSTKRHLHTIDTPLTAELIPLTAEVSGTITVYKLRGDGGVEGAGLAAAFSNLVMGKYFSLALVDRSNDQIIFSLPQCSVESQNWDINSKRYVMGQIVFSALSWSNEAGG